MATTITVFPTSARADGTYTSATAAWDGATSTGVSYIPVCTQANWAAFAGTLEVQIEQSLDGGVTWEFVSGATFNGNVWGRGGSPTLPSGSFQARFDNRGARQVRAKLILAGTGGTLTVGLSATLNAII